MDEEWVYMLHDHYDDFVDLLVQFGYCRTEDIADDWLSTELNLDAMFDALNENYPHKDRMKFILDMIYHMDLDCYPTYSETSIREIANMI